MPLSRTRLARLALAGLAAFALLGAGAVGAPSRASVQDSARGRQFEELRERLNGRWVLAVPQASAQRTVDAAIERAVNAMNMIMRGVARPMLRDNTPINRSITFELRSVDAIHCRFDTGASYTTPLGGTRNGQTLDGDTLRVTQRYNDGGLEQVFEADQGTRWNVYRPLPDGRLRVDATTNGDMMPQPLRFSLTYRRAG